MDIVIDLHVSGNMPDTGRIVAADCHSAVVDTSAGLALCVQSMTAHPLAVVIGDLAVMRTCPHALRGIVRAYMLRTRIG